MKKRSICLAALVSMLVLSAGMGSAWAYFTTYARAQGGYTIELGDRTEFTEDFSNWTKELVVSSNPDSQPVYVRARAFAGGSYPLAYSDASGKWAPGEDGYYYYSDILPGGGHTETLSVHIDGIREEPEDGETFNVVVIYETTPVRYHEDGSPYADWEQILDSKVTEGGVS